MKILIARNICIGNEQDVVRKKQLFIEKLTNSAFPDSSESDPINVIRQNLPPDPILKVSSQYHLMLASIINIKSY